MSMTSPRSPIVFDAYTPFSYKEVISDRYRLGLQWLAPTWVGEHRRRLQAYAMLQAYRDNAAREFVRILSGDDLEAKKNRREYGDPALFIEQVRSSLIGDQQSIVLQDADKYDPKATEGQEPGFQAASERQEFIRQWAEDERMQTKVVEVERDAVSFGDGVYSLSWDESKHRPILTCYDPGNYFPVLDSVATAAFPTKVHLAWELTAEESHAKGYPLGQIIVHRITYELLDVGDPVTLPWDDEPAKQMCFMTEAEYPVTQDSRTPDDLSENSAYFMEDADGVEINLKPLGIDFIPVIHIPNTVAEKEHYGKSVLSNILQILDDLQLTDSDLQASAAVTGSPMLALSGDGVTSTTKIVVGPGEAITLGANGKAEMLSGADGLGALAKYRDDLLNRASVNGRIPAAVLGMVDPGKVAAGVVLSLSFGPLESLIEEMRLARKDKYRVLLRFVQRYMILNGIWLGDVIDGDLVFGSYLPSDRTGTVKDVVSMFTSGLIGQATAMKMLQEVGVPIEDVGEEIKSINKRDFSAGIQLLDATGNDAAVSEFLGVEVIPTPPPRPAVVVPTSYPTDVREGEPTNQQKKT